jgi:hypothetical protein
MQILDKDTNDMTSVACICGRYNSEGWDLRLHGFQVTGLLLTDHDGTKCLSDIFVIVPRARSET